MAMSQRRTSKRRALTPAIALATLAHLLAFLVLGWRIPEAPAPPQPDNLPPIEIQLVRPPTVTPAAPRPSSAISSARPSPARPEPSSVPAPPASAPAPRSPALAAGSADCEPEDLPLLTDAEKARCRNQIDADDARRLARGAGERASRQVAEAQRGPQTYRMSSAKEAYYGAVADAYWQQSHGPPMAGHTPGIGCSVQFSGLKVGRSKPPPHSLSLGPCFLAPPQGFLTEENRVAPP